MGGWKERRMNVVGRRYGKGLSSEEEKKKVWRGRIGKDDFWTENCEGIQQVL